MVSYKVSGGAPSIFISGLQADQRQYGDGSEIAGPRQAGLQVGTRPEQQPAGGHHAPEGERHQTAANHLCEAPSNY